MSSKYKDPFLCVLALSVVLFGGYHFVYKPTMDQSVSEPTLDTALKEAVNPPPRPVPASVTEGIIPLETDEGFSFVHIGVNGSRPLICLIDSGAFALILTRKQMNYLWDNRFVTKADIAGEGKGTGANGKSFKIIEMNLRRVDIGGVESCSDGTCLVGQSFLQRFKSWRVDNAKHELHLEFSAPWIDN
jgi:hypothetical protein